MAANFEAVAFVIMALVAILGALGCVYARRVAHSLLSLMMTFFAVAGVMVLAHAEMLAAIYLPIGIIYAFIGMAFILMDIEYLKVTGYIFILAPFWLSLMVAVAHYFVASIYNYLASKIGGFEFEFTEIKD